MTAPTPLELLLSSLDVLVTLAPERRQAEFEAAARQAGNAAAVYRDEPGQVDPSFARVLLVTNAKEYGLDMAAGTVAFERGLAEVARATRPAWTPPRDPMNGTVDGTRDDGSAAAEAASASTLPVVLVPGPHRTDTSTYVEVGTDDFARSVLEALGPNLLYRMDRVVGELVGDAGSKRFIPLSEHRLRLLIDQRMSLQKWVKDRKTDARLSVFVPCGRDHASLVLAAAEASEAVRELEVLVNHPVYLPGFERAASGWNTRGGVFYDEPADLAGLTDDLCYVDASAALEVLDDLVVDFVLKDEASRQNIYAAMLTKILRPAIEGPIPFFLWMAPLERTGKGKSIDTTVGFGVQGSQVRTMQLGREEAETEKRITTLVLKGVSVVHFDNVPVGEVVDSPSLASLATAWPRWSGRKLGESSAPDLPNRILVLLSGNNPKATGELVKRTVPIVLQPKDDHPELRPSEDYEHPDPFAYAKERRAAVLGALISLVEAWKAAGRPSPPASVCVGGFERWTEGVIGPLWHAGATQVLGNYRAWCASADDANADAEVLVNAWSLRHGMNQITARQVLELVRAADVFRDVLNKPTELGQVVSLSKTVLTPLTDRPVGMWIVRRKGSGGSSLYSLAKATP